MKNLSKILPTAKQTDRDFIKNEILWKCFDQKAKIHYCNLIKGQCTNHVETSQSVYSTNQLNVFCILQALTTDLK